MNKTVKLSDGHVMYLDSFQRKVKHVQKELNAAHVNAKVSGRTSDTDEHDLEIEVDNKHDNEICRVLKTDRFKIKKTTPIDKSRVLFSANLY